MNGTEQSVNAEGIILLLRSKQVLVTFAWILASGLTTATELQKIKPSKNQNKLLGEISPTGPAHKKYSLPFWRKDRIFSRIVDQREVVVVVKKRPNPNDKVHPYHLTMEGAALIAMPRKYAFKNVTDFNSLTSVTSHIKEAKWQPQKHFLYLHTEAYGHHARMHMKIELSEDKKQGDIHVSEMRWRITQGTFEGMSGVLSFEDLKRRKCIMSMTAEYNFAKLPLPEFFIEFGIEVVLQKMAARIRSWSEQRFQQADSQID